MKYVFRKKRNTLAAAVIDALGWGLSFPFRGAPPKGPVKTALLMRFDHLGDVLLVTGLPKLLKESFGCRVIVATATASAPLFAENPFVDEVIEYDARWFLRGGKRKARHTLWTLAADLRRRKIDLAIAPRGDLRENFLLWLAEIPRRVSYGITGGGFFLTDEVAYPRGVHESVRAMKLFERVGIRAPFPAPKLYFSEDEKRAFAQKTVDWGVDEGAVVGFQIGAGSRAKEWPEANRREFFELFAKRFPEATLLVVGGAAQEVDFPKGLRARNLSGKTSLRELALLVSRCAAFVGPDSGPSHLASALGVPTLFLYSRTNRLEEWGPLSDSARVLRSAGECPPCARFEYRAAGHPCMAGIAAESVARALEEIREKLGERWYTRRTKEES